MTQTIGVSAGRQEECRAGRQPAALPADCPLALSEVPSVPGLPVRSRGCERAKACAPAAEALILPGRQLSARFPCICKPPTQDDIRVLEPERKRDFGDVMNKVKLSHLSVHCLVEKKNG